MTKDRKGILYSEKGNVTIEAAFVFPMVFIIIIMLVFLMLFYYNKVAVWNNTYYVGIKLAEAKREGTVYDLEGEWDKISKDTLVLPDNIRVSMKKGVDSITVTGKVEFYIPFWGKTKIQEKSSVPFCSGRETLARNKLWKK